MKSRTFAAKYFSGLVIASAVSAGIMIQQYYDFKERWELRERQIEQPKIESTKRSEIERIIDQNYEMK